MSTKVYNITTFGGVLDGQKVLNATLSIANGGFVLSSPTALWVPGDATKAIGFSTADVSGGTGTIFFGSTISSVAGDGKSVTLANAFTGTALVASTQSVEWGTNSTSALDAFNTAALAWQTAHPTDTFELDIVGPGRIEVGLCYPFRDIKDCNLVCSGGAIISNCNGAFGGYPIQFGSRSQYQTNTNSTRVATVPSGATSVTVVPSPILPGATTVEAAVGLFTVGVRAMLLGIDLQSGIGFPSNPAFREFVLITGKDAGTGEITLSSPLRNSYKSTWPLYNYGVIDGFDHGGPATLYALHPGWDVRHNYIDLILDTPTAYSGSAGRNITFTNPTFIRPALSCATPYFGYCGSFPSVNESWNIVGGNIGVFNIEVDKIIGSMSVSGLTAGTGAINFQSGSVDNFAMDNCSIALMLGTPSRSAISNSTITQFRPGAYSYGRTDSIVLSNNVLPLVEVTGGVFYQGSLSEGINNIPGVSLSGGILTIPNSYIRVHDGSISWAVPGNWVAWCDANQFNATPTYFQIADLTQDATNTYVHMNWSGGFPSWSFNTVLGIRVHSCPDMTCIDCAGVAPTTADDGSYAYSMSQAPPRTPFLSYLKKTLTNATLAAAEYWSLLGYIKKFNVTVNTAYTGALAATIQPIPLSTGQFLDSANANTAYATTFNLKVAGARTLNAGQSYPVVWTGAQSGDTLPNLTQRLWWNDGVYRQAAADLSGDPGHPVSVTLELQADQGISRNGFLCRFA